MKWWKLQAIAVEVMIAGIILEIIVKADWVWTIFSGGIVLAYLSEKKRVKLVKKKLDEIKEKLNRK